MSLAQRARDEAREEGLQEGWQKGRQEGEIILLLEQIQEKFGEVPEFVRHQIQKASQESLLLWSRRILKANSVDELFRD